MTFTEHECSQLTAFLRMERLRRKLFGENAFPGRTWWLLLILLEAHLEGKRLYLTEVSARADVLNSTASKAMHSMQQRGIVHLVPDPEDTRATLVDLPTATLHRMQSLMRSLLEPGDAPVQ